MILRKIIKSEGVCEARISSRCTATPEAMTRAQVVIAAPSVWQTGQACESIAGEFRSTQQCNCAARNMLARSKART